jgi:putative endonuclease
MECVVYILWSESLGKFYVGSTGNLEKRFIRHNKGQEKFTAKGIPWQLIWSNNYNSRSEAYGEEIRIKKRGINRFLIDVGIGK